MSSNPAPAKTKLWQDKYSYIKVRRPRIGTSGFFYSHSHGEMDHHATPPFCILRKGWMSVLLCSLTAPCAMNERTQWAIKYALKLRRGAAYRIPLAHPQWKLRHANPCYFRKVGEKGHLHFGIFCCIFAQANVKVSLPEAFFSPPKAGLRFGRP